MADVSVDASISTGTARGMRTVVFASDQIGYVFYLDADGVLGYTKTTDGGGTWGAQVDIDTANSVVAYDVWFDKWTPGDSGTLIHVWWFDTTNDIVRWRSLDTNGDTFGTVRAVFTGASAVAGRGAFVSGTKTISGVLAVTFDIDAGAERGTYVSVGSPPTSFATLTTQVVEATLDTCKLYPASGTGDNDDFWALYYDASALALTLKLYDRSAGNVVESATIGVAHTDGATDLTGQFGYDGAIRHSDGHLIVVALSDRDVAASQHQVFDITNTSTITTKTAIAASTDDHYYPQIQINQGTGVIYVAYNGKRDGSETMDTTTKVYYTSSTDGGTTWSAGDTAYMEGTAGNIQQVWTPKSGNRFYAVWRSGIALVGNKVNSVLQLGISSPTIAAGSALYLPTVALAAVQTVSGVFISPPGGGSAAIAFDMTSYGYSAGLSLTNPHVFGSLTNALFFVHVVGASSFGDHVTGATIDGAAMTLLFKSNFAGATRWQYWFYKVLGTISGSKDLVVTSTDFDLTSLAVSYQGVTQAAPDNWNWNSGFASAVGFPVTTIAANCWLVVSAVTASPPLGAYPGATQRINDTARGIFDSNAGMPAGANGLTITGGTFIGGMIASFEPAAAVGSTTIYAPTISQTTPTTQDVTGTTIGSGSSVTAPTDLVIVLHQAVTGATLAIGSSVTAPTVAPGAVTITGVTLTTGVVVRVPTVAPGAVTISGVTRATTAQVFAATVTVGPVTVIGATRATTVQLFAPEIVSVALGATIPSGSGLFAPSVAYTVVLATRGTTSTVFVPAVAIAVTLPAIAVTSLVRVPSVTVSAVTIIGPHKGATSQFFAPTIAVGPTAVTTATETPTSLVFSPSVVAGPTTVVVAHRSTTQQLFAPTVLGAGVLGLTTIPSTLQIFPPTLTAAAITIGGATITNVVQLIAPTVQPGAVTIGGPTRVTTSQLFAPIVLGTGYIGIGSKGSTVVLFPPTVALALIQTVVTSSITVAAQGFPPTVAHPVIGPNQEIDLSPLVLTSALFPPDIWSGKRGISATSDGVTVQSAVTASCIVTRARKTSCV